MEGSGVRSGLTKGCFAGAELPQALLPLEWSVTRKFQVHNRFERE